MCDECDYQLGAAMKTMLRDILPIVNQKEFKVHFARWNKTSEPLDVFTKDKREWQRWQEHRDDFNRPLIFSLANFYHEPGTWLFGGIFRVLARNKKHYKVELTESAAGLIGRLRLRSSYSSRATRVNMESHYDEFEVAEVLREAYTGRPFPGYEDIELSFQEIETLVRNGCPDWQAALESVKGIYLITDTLTGKRYVGKASGESGVWSRWCAYLRSGHGGNVELRALVTNPNLDYCRANFRFALLEHRPFRTGDDLIAKREDFWKRLLLTRGDQGLNRN